MKKHTFEKQIRDKFQDAEIKAPLDTWEKIESKLDLENAFENQFKNSFLNASLEPDDSVWLKIESQLNEKKKRRPVFFIWFNTWTATGIAALLLLSFGLFYFSGLDMPLADQQNAPAQYELNTKEKKEVFDKTQRDPALKITTEKRSEKLNASAQFKTKSTQTKITTKSKIEPKTASLPFDIEPDITKNAQPPTLLASLSEELVNTTDYFIFGNSIKTKRNKLPFETKKEHKKNRTRILNKSWLGFISGLSPFDPNLSFNNFERATAVSNNNSSRILESNSLTDAAQKRPKNETFAIPLAQPYTDTRSGRGISLGFDYVKGMGRFLSIQGGIRYFSGQSMVKSNVYSYNQYTGDIKTFLESYYIRKDKVNDVVVASGNYLDNNYTYFMLPVQLGLHLPLAEKLEMTVSSGVSADVFINNVLDHTPEKGSKLTAANSAYKLLNISGIGSLKANYRISKDWQFSLGTNFQQSINSGVAKSEGFSFRPRYIGISTGINYRLN